MTAFVTEAVRFTCDRKSCGVTAFVPKTSTPQPAPDGWLELSGLAGTNLTFDGPDCMLAFLDTLTVSDRDSGLTTIRSVASYRVGPES